MKILGKQFVFGRTIDEALKRAAPERGAGTDPQLRHARRGGAHPCRRCPLRQGLCRGARPHRQGSGGRLPLVAGHFGQAVGAPPALRMEPCRGGQGGDAAGAARAGAEGVARPTSISPSTPRKPTGSSCRSTSSRRWPPTTSCSPTAGAVSASRSRPIRSAPCRLCDWVADLGPQARPPASWSGWSRAPIGTRRSRRRRSPGCDDYPVFTRKVATDVSYLACAKRLLAAERCASTPPSPPTTPTPSARSRRWPARPPFEFQRLHGMGEGLYEELARLEEGIGDAPHAGAHLRAGRQPQGAARLSRPPPARERRQLELRQPHRRRAGVARRAGPRSGRRARRAEPKRNPKISFRGIFSAAARHNSAGVDLQRSAGARAAARSG